MKFLIFASLALCALAVQGRYIEEELVRTPWMNRRPAPGARITNGYPADIADFPYQLVFLNINTNSLCGASIIHRVWSLTAAHCAAANVNPAFINLRGGSTNRLTGGAIFFVQTWTRHPAYNGATLANDISIMRVQDDTPMEGIPHVAPVALSPSCATACCQTCTNVPVTVTGWGRNELGQLPVNLQQLTQPIHDHADCNRIWGGIGGWFFCKQVFDGRDSCNGDSGSPLVATHGGTVFQVGLVSFGTSNCGSGTAPSVNTRIEHPAIRSWITERSGL